MQKIHLFSQFVVDKIYKILSELFVFGKTFEKLSINLNTMTRPLGFEINYNQLKYVTKIWFSNLIELVKVILL